ncbi:MAG: DUF4249 family protein [Bacteroidales bacterium]
MNLKITLLLSLLSILNTACLERIHIDANAHTPELIIIGILSGDTFQKITITKSVSYFGGKIPPPVLEANVWVNNQAFSLTDSTKGEYTSHQPIAIEEGKTYTLKVLYDFDKDGIQEEYTAQDIAPAPMQVLFINFLPTSFAGDTTIYAPRFLINGLIQRHPKAQYIGFEQYINNQWRKVKLRESVIGEIPLNFGSTFVPPFGIYSIGRGAFHVDGSTDTLYYAPFDTLGVQALSLSKDLFSFKMAAQTELNANDPFFGGPPANIPSNIQGNNVRGCFGVATATPPATLILPMNQKTLDGQYYISLVDSTTIIQVQQQGTAHYVNGDNAGKLYFHKLSVNPSIRGFDAYDQEGKILQFTMKNYNEFVSLLDQSIAWKRYARIP